MSIITQNTRPNLQKLTNNELIDIINNSEDIDIENLKKMPRITLIDNIYRLWSNNEINDHFNKPIECLICYDLLKNGDNMTFVCGHKFHSSCVIKHLLIFSTDSYHNYLNDDNIQSIKIEYCCPQCRYSIEHLEFNKNLEN